MTLGDLLTIFLIDGNIITGKEKNDGTVLSCVGYCISVAGYMRNYDRAFRTGTVCKSQDFDLNFSYNDWSCMDSLVHKHTAFNSDEKESGTGNTDIPS